MICLILMKETSTSKEIHVELTECVLQIINDQKLLAKNLNDYHLVDEMCIQIRPFLVGDKNNFSRLLSRLQKQNDRVSFTLKKKINFIVSIRTEVIHFIFYKNRYLMIWL